MIKPIHQLVSSFVSKTMLALLILSTLLVPSLSYSEESAVKLLNRMNQALHQLSYKGTLAYLRGDELSTLEVTHAVTNGTETERVVRISASGGEVSREVKGFSLASIPRILPEMEKVYSFDIGRASRIADIPCVIVTARPKDRARYLQKYCINLATGMLLDYMLVGKSHKPVEQFMFTALDIELPEGTNISELTCQTQYCANNTRSAVNSIKKATTIVEQSVAMKQGSQSAALAPQKAEPKLQQASALLLDDGWVLGALPAGYVIRQAPQLEDENHNITKHYIVSDGLSSLSVFVSPIMDNLPKETIRINSGALNVVSQRKAGHVVTVVGEVPEMTLKNIVKNLQKK